MSNASILHRTHSPSNRGRRLASVVGVLAVVLCVACGLVACGEKAPATTEELLIRYAANKDMDNVSGEVEANLSLQVLGVRCAVPISAKFQTAERTAHGTITANLSSLESADYEVELYAELRDDALVCYLGTHDGKKTSWKCWTVNTTSKIDILTVTDLLSAAELTLLSKDSDPEVAYELTVPLSKVVETAERLTADPIELGDLDATALQEAVAKEKLAVDFTKNCLMRSITANARVTYKDSEVSTISVPAQLSLHAVFDDYGEVDPGEVAVPQSVRDAAVPTDSPIDSDNILSPDSPLAQALD